MQPIIGITAGYSNSEEKHFLTDYYIQVIENLGGVPVILPSVEISMVEAIYEQVDGVIFSGGGDIDPGYFGQSPLRGIKEITPNRDRFELYLAKKALNGSKPVLGICRGMQILNIAAGGNLHQDIRGITNQEHDQQAPKWVPYHEVQLAENTMLLEIIGKKKIKVNSFHHQAVKDLGQGFVKAAWSEDNITEAIVNTGKNKLIIGVQWHPECSWDKDKNSRALFEFLIYTAAKGKE